MIKLTDEKTGLSIKLVKNYDNNKSVYDLSNIKSFEESHAEFQGISLDQYRENKKIEMNKYLEEQKIIEQYENLMTEKQRPIFENQYKHIPKVNLNKVQMKCLVELLDDNELTEYFNEIYCGSLYSVSDFIECRARYSAGVDKPLNKKHKNYKKLYRRLNEIFSNYSHDINELMDLISIRSEI